MGYSTRRVLSVLGLLTAAVQLAAQPATPVITKVTVAGTVVTVSGTALDGRESAGVFAVQLGGTALSVQSATPAQIVATSDSSIAAGTYPLAIVFKDKNGNRPDTAAAVLRADVTAGTTGAMGPMGPQGPAGSNGPVGPQGPIGLTGPAGPIGPAGPQGLIGLSGPAGPQGETGATGPQGMAGPAGPQGLIGLTGPAGTPGPTGPIGPQGVAGAVGPMGPAGPTGAAGPAGPIGPQGVAGAIGPVGPAGPTGASGPSGPIGPQGVVGPIGPVGPVGAAGVAGPQGLVGPAGPVGPQGTPGPNTKSIATLRWYAANRSSQAYLPGNTVAAAFDGDHMWVAANSCCPSVWKLRASDFVFASSPFGGAPVNAIVADGRHIWTATASSGAVAKFDSSTGGFMLNLLGIPNPTAMMFDGMHVWATNPAGGNVSRITVNTGAVGNFPSTPGGEAVAFDGEFVWIAGTGMLAKLNPLTGAVAGSYLYGGGATGGAGLAFDGTHMWVSHIGSSVVGKYRVSDGGHVGSYAVQPGPRGVVFDGTHIWVASVSGVGSVTKLRAIDGGMVGTYTTATPGAVGGALAFDGSNVWVMGGPTGVQSKM